MAKKRSQRPGRRPGSKNREVQQVLVQGGACPKCNSTNRTKYTQTRKQHHTGERDGKPFNQIVRRWCQCVDCGQWRIEKHFEFDPALDETQAEAAATPTTKPPEADHDLPGIRESNITDD